VLKHHRVQQVEQHLKVGEAWEDKDLVFTDLHGGYMNPRYVVKQFDKLLQETGIPHMRFHDLRHNAATILLSMGVELKVIQQILGHGDIAVTGNIYAHVSLAMQRIAMDKWDGKFGGENDQNDTSETGRK
jgi:integrase